MFHVKHLEERPLPRDANLSRIPNRGSGHFLNYLEGSSVSNPALLDVSRETSRRVASSSVCQPLEDTDTTSLPLSELSGRQLRVEPCPVRSDPAPTDLPDSIFRLRHHQEVQKRPRLPRSSETELRTRR